MTAAMSHGKRDTPGIERPSDTDPPSSDSRPEPTLPYPAGFEDLDPLGTPQRLSMFNRERLAPTWFITLYIASFIGCIYTLGPFLHDLILAGVLLVLFRPAYDWLFRRLKRPWVCSTITVALIVAVVAVPFALLTVTLVQEATNAYNTTLETLTLKHPQTASLTSAVREYARDYGIKLTADDLAGYIADSARAIKQAVAARASAVLDNALAALIHFTVILLVVFYLMVDGGRFKTFVFELSPLPRQQEEMILDTFRRVSRGILLGNGIASVAQGGLAGAAMALVGLPSPVLWATVMSVLAFLPLVGVSIVVVPASAYLLITERYTAAFWFFVFCTAQGLIIENIVKTRLISRGTRMHDLVVFLSVLGGLSAFGVLGLLYGPLIATAFLTLTDLYKTHYRRALALRSLGMPPGIRRPMGPG